MDTKANLDIILNSELIQALEIAKKNSRTISARRV